VTSESTARPPEKLRVVVADDDPSVRRAMAWLLRSACEVIPCLGTDHEVVDIALASDPDVIICDAMLPAFFGCETLQPLIEYSFVLISDAREDIQHWIDHGNCCVVHPMDLDSDLVAAVQAAAAGKIHISRRALEATGGTPAAC
jgi:DNA-binding NarL/FixJ family response regulator